MAVRPKGTKWQVDVTVGGKRLPRFSFDTKAEALAWEAKARSAALNGEDIIYPDAPDSGRRSTSGSSRITVREACVKTYERFYNGTTWGDKAYFYMKQFQEQFGPDTPLADIGTMEIDGFMASCRSKGNANATINKKLAILSKVYRYCRERGLIDVKPPWDRLKSNSGRIRWLSGDEERALLDLLTQWSKTDHADVVTCLIDTGMRPSELYRLTPRDIDLKQGTVSIWQTKTDLPRTIYMTKRVLGIVKARLGTVTIPTGKLFPYDNFWMRNVWDRAKVTLGFEGDKHFVPYICRHTCASRMVQRGVPISVVKEWLGHKSITMTMRYAHLAPTNLRAAADVLEAAE
jgi:integrase